MLSVFKSNIFNKDVERLRKRGKNLKKLSVVMQLLVEQTMLPPKNREHKLLGNYADCWECHIEPDWLLIYEKTDQNIFFIRTGTHSDLF